MLQQEQDYQDCADIPTYQGYQAIPEDEIETVYLYAYTEDPEKRFSWNKDQLVACCMGVLALALIVGLCFIPNTPSYTIQMLTLPAQFLPVQHVQASIAVVPTGLKQYPATSAHGVLTIYNGSFLTEQLPAEFLLTTQNGIEVAIDQAVIVPAGNPPNYGMATVPAHAVLAGSQGNIPANTLNERYGDALSITNLSAFSGGQDALQKTYVTAQDQAKALASARAQVAQNTPIGLLAHPCTETVKQSFSRVSVILTCQLVTYQIPKQGQILSVQVSGKKVIVRVKVVVPVVVHVVK